MTGITLLLILAGLLWWDVREYLAVWWMQLAIVGGVTAVIVVIYQVWLWTPETMKRSQKHQIIVHCQEQKRLQLNQVKKAGLLLSGAGLPLASVRVDAAKRHEGLIGLSSDRLEGHLLVAGATRSGKGMHLTQTLLTADSAMLVIDLKGEQWERTAGYRSQHVGAVYRVPGSTVDLADYYDLNKRDDIEELVFHLLKPWQDRQPIFAEKCKFLVAAANAYARVHQLNPVRVLFDAAESAPITTLTAFASVAPDLIHNFTNGSPFDDLDRFTQSAFGTFSTRMFPYQHHIDTLTTGTGFGAIPHDWAARKGTIYVTYPFDALKGVGAAIAAFVAALLRYQKLNGRRDPIVFAIDELPAVGLRNLGEYLATVGSNRISIVSYIQSWSQLVEMYGRQGAESIMSNSQNQVWYPPADRPTAERMSHLYGTTLRPSQSFSSGSRDKRFIPDLGMQERSRSLQLHIRPALSPEEMMALSKEEVIVRYERGVVVKAYRLWPVPQFEVLPPVPYELVVGKVGERPLPHWKGEETSPAQKKSTQQTSRAIVMSDEQFNS